MSCRCYYVGPDGESYNPSLKAPKTFDVEKDCIALREAMKGIGTDENAIIEILGHRNTEQRLKIRDHYKTMYGKDLIEKLKGELTGNFEKLVVMLLTDGPTIKAKALYDAMKGAGTKESVIIEILCTASNDEIAAIKQAYETFNFRRSWALTNRCLFDSSPAEASGTSRLSQKLMKRCNTLFIRLLKDLRQSSTDYSFLGADQTTGHSLMDAIDSETSGDFRDALMLTLSACILRLRAYSDLLACSMAGLGTNDSSLMRIIVTRCEIDLKDISRQFEADQGKSLAQPLTRRSVVRTPPLPLDFSCLGVDNLAVSQPSCNLWVAWQLGTERVLQLNDLRKISGRRFVLEQDRPIPSQCL
ncbi:Annexin B11 [Clonorchis sinensis]|uniref:Annexin n=1 Tax=Clonorchis sinensis TaxID=79923 RepID=A0A3R7GUI9_CLOSI|nr:Annexin B11 [Clonorchis sinensis]